MVDAWEFWDQPKVEELRRAAHEFLQDGPLGLADLRERLAASGALDWLRSEGVDDEEDSAEIIEVMLPDDDVWFGPDHLVALSAHLLDGLTLTHRLTLDEITEDAVLMAPDLSIIDACHPGMGGLGSSDEAAMFILPDGSGTWSSDSGDHVPGEDRRMLRGPSGWLDRFSAGDLLAFVRRGDVIAVDAVEAPDLGGPGEHELTLLRRAADWRIPSGASEEVYPVIFDALTLDPGAFRASVPPLSELLVSAGLEHRGFSWGRTGEEWLSAGEEWAARQRETIASSWGFESCCFEAFDAVVEAYLGFGRGEPVSRDVARALEHGDVARAFADFLTERRARVISSSEAAVFLDEVSPRHREIRGRGGAAVCVVLSLLAALEGDQAQAEELIRQAVRLDDTYGPGVESLGGYELDRGDVEAALRLLRQVDAQQEDEGESPLIGELEDYVETSRGFAAASGRSIRRNDPCPCGSGRKFKQCCQGRVVAVPLEHRTGLLMLKVQRFAIDGVLRSRLIGLASAVAQARDPSEGLALDALDEAEDDGFVERIIEAATDPLVADFALWEGGIADDYLDQRGHLLPEDERALLTAMLEQSRRLFEIVGVQSGRALDLRDTASGDIFTVQERQGSLGRSVGELLMARLAAANDTFQLMGAVMEVPLRLRAAAISLVDAHPDAEELARWYGRATQPPAFATTEGEPLLLHRASIVLENDDLDAASAALDNVLEATNRDKGGSASGERTWLFTNGTADVSLVRGLVTLSEGDLSFVTNSSARFHQLRDLLLGSLPGAQVLDVEVMDPRRPGAPTPEDWLGSFQDGDDNDGDFVVALQADLESSVSPEFLEGLMREKAAAWLDESIPALGGLTPRQAVDDPTRREDLIALLGEFERSSAKLPPDMASFDTTYLRSMLGLA